MELAVYDLKGRLVRTLVDGVLPAGPDEAVWDGRTDAGREAASGAYFYRLKTEKGIDRGKMVLLK